LAEEIVKNYNVKPELIPGRGGIFDVTVDDQLVFSKMETRRFPIDGEISKLIENIY